MATDAILESCRVHGLGSASSILPGTAGSLDTAWYGGRIQLLGILKIERGRIRLQTFHYIDELPTPDQPEWEITPSRQPTAR